ncbi:T9SS type A sorting domain-containing protein [Prolixibacter denitrificans]|uniref:Putative secreted protein (Por secretion system target) n=1 Tax=Prolixibacter denitrificans TaxID=1541063 RepID=A0A2P8CLA6_9BACT|nr:T9SS type A sorting domain-containing protein [Prolixibacter denitrificans]PSK85752.1 putative secreted protein (Por secretion system target) [Prolixibacter denitrificans]GET20371.1 hypothetical protein JCM18694_06170 [Prolixibacter denitrificans]
MHNLKKLNLLFFLSIVAFSQLKAQDTLRVMQYNLLNYGKDVYSCDQQTNNRDDKNGYLKILFGYYLPDIFTVNEMNGDEADVKYLLDHALNADGRNQYAQADFSGTYLINMLYYNTNKLALKWQGRLVLGSNERDANFYRLYYKSPDLADGADTVFINYVVVHLKAGSTTDDINTRATETKSIMTELEQMGWNGNVIFSGDCNLYNSDEQAFQNLIAPSDVSYSFYDPIGQEGNWHSNDTYALYHTQSTHSVSGCASGGGMDDRFDFILVQEDLLNNTNNLSYKEGSYKAIGQDGQHFNQSLIDGSNADYPADLVTALYNNSDHLPVTMQLVVDQTATGISDVADVGVRLLGNPVSGIIKLEVQSQLPQFGYQLFSISGNAVKSGVVYPSRGTTVSIPTGKLPAGIYLLKLKIANKAPVTFKVILQ